MLSISEVVIYTWQVGVCQVRQQMHLTIECIGSFSRLLGSKSAQIDLLHSKETISILGIFYLVDSPKATQPHWGKHTVTLFEQWFPRRYMQRGFTDATTLCLMLVGCTTIIAVKLRRKSHTCSTFSRKHLWHILFTLIHRHSTHRIDLSPDTLNKLVCLITIDKSLLQRKE